MGAIEPSQVAPADPRNIDRLSDTDIIITYLKRKREQGDKLLTRSGRTEVRHVCHYAAGSLQDLRTAMLRDEMTSALAVVELREVIADLEGLIAYLETGKGGFSALGDRNAR
jgi:hypothetical protein